MHIWQELLQWFGGFAVLASALTYLLKTIITHSLSKDLEIFKAQLDEKLEDHKDQLQRETKRFEHSLAVLAQEQSARFTKLHEKRVGLLTKMYYLLENSYNGMDWLNVGCEEPSGTLVEGCAQETQTTNRKLFDFFRRNKLYFSEVLAQQIQTVVFDLQSFPFDILVATSPGHTPEEVTQCRLKFIADWKEQSPKLRKAMSLVEAEFRKLLGSDIETFSGRN